MRVHTGASPVAEQIRDYRRKTGYTQHAVAKLLGTSENNVARWERGAVWPDPSWRQRILVLINGGQSEGGTPLSHALAQFRATHAFSQAEAAQCFGCGERTWQAWEAGARRPNKTRQTVIWRFLDGFTLQAGASRTAPTGSTQGQEAGQRR